MNLDDLNFIHDTHKSHQNPIDFFKNLKELNCTCIECNKPFKPNGKGKMCSDACRAARKNYKARKRRKRSLDKECIECGEFFTANSPQQKLCSKKCNRVRYIKHHARGRFIIYNRDKFKCIYCGLSSIIDEHTILILEHVVPIVDGGLSNAANVATACATCNNQKGSININSESQRVVLEEMRRRNVANDILPTLVIKECNHSDRVAKLYKSGSTI